MCCILSIYSYEEFILCWTVKYKLSMGLTWEHKAQRPTQEIWTSYSAVSWVIYCWIGCIRLGESAGIRLTACTTYCMFGTITLKYKHRRFRALLIQFFYAKVLRNLLQLWEYIAPCWWTFTVTYQFCIEDEWLYLSAISSLAHATMKLVFC